MDTTTVVLEYFAQHGQKPLSGSTREQQLTCAYLDEGVVDSMGIVELVTHLEAACSVQFTAEDMQSYEFQTPGGLVELIKRHQAQSS